VVAAPADGIVTQFGVSTVGGVVTAGEALVRIVPIGDALEVTATIPNRDTALFPRARRPSSSSMPSITCATAL